MLNSMAYHIMAKPGGSLCNMDCRYCFYLEKKLLYPGNKHWKMSDQVLDKFIRQYIQTQRVNEITFAWQGGEPALLGLNFFRKAVRLQKTYAGGKSIYNTFQTNALLIDRQWAEFFAENNFLVGVSIDGPEEIHNKYRVLKGEQPTFKRVLKAINYLKNCKVEFNTLTCVSKANEDEPLQVYNFLKEAGSRFIQFIPIVERIAQKAEKDELKLVSPQYREAIVTDWSVDSLKYGKFLCSVFDEWIKKDVGRYFVQTFDTALEAWFGQRSSLCIFNDVCGNAMAMEHNGDLYACDHYVYPEYKLGNIIFDSLHTMVNSEKQSQFGLDKKVSLPEYCRDCEFLFACNGECPKHRFKKTPDGKDGLNYLCSGYKYFFRHIDSAMKFMANELKNERPPANVMNCKLS